jgi:predicted CopG family antitoxin
MNRSIKVSPQVYDMLLELQKPRETFSQIIERLITIRLLLEKATPFMVDYRDVLKAKLEKETLHDMPKVS